MQLARVVRLNAGGSGALEHQAYASEFSPTQKRRQSLATCKEAEPLYMHLARRN